MSPDTERAVAMIALAREANPQNPMAYLLGLAVGYLQAEGHELADIQAMVAMTFNTSWEEAAAAAQSLEQPRSEPS